MIKPIIFLLLLSLFSNACTTESKTITLGIISDLTGSSNYTRALYFLDLAAQRLRSKGITQAISLGDLVESLSGIMIQQFNNVTSILSRRGIRLEAITAGDHDVISDYVQNSQNHTNEIIYRKLLTNYGMPPNKGRMYYYVEVDDLVVINLYSLQSLGTDPRWGNTFWSRIQEDQLKWLNDVLFQFRTRPIVVITHQPLWYQVSNWYDVHDALRTYGNVLHVIAGHFHYTQYNGEYDDIPYTVVGATGGNTKQGNSNAGDVRLYGILTVTCKGQKNSAEIALYSLDSPNDSRLVIPPAKAMDRVQQQSIINGDLPYGYITIPSVLFYNSASGIIGTACNSTTPVTFSLIAANAHNIDQVFNIQLLPNNIFTLAKSNFVPGQWKKVLNSTAAVIGGGKNCDLSSFSVSEIVSYYDPIVNMWTGVPAVVPGGWTGSTVMTFRYSTSFALEGLTYYLYSDITTSVTACQ